ncbi:hypothetical protein GCM10023188_30370 [Pontibacter saemangeumensis]|uniref:Uncharacterized protein n=1 Tax=Pontibacter saemangeumensis TaxID=1084525 RepID=A0ABP8LTZ0_9BACT
MAANVTQVLEEFEAHVRDGKIITFWVTVGKDGLCLQAGQSGKKREIPLEEDLVKSLAVFFYGVDRIEYKSHDYANLKSFINARAMLDRLLNKEDT